MSVVTFTKKLLFGRCLVLVTSTAIFGYVLSPGVFHVPTLIYLTAGTFLTAAAANCFNQVFEFPYDSQMQRTKNRVVAKGTLSSFHALNFGIFSFVCGALVLFAGTNAVTGFLGAFNVILYSIIYTFLKRNHVINTYIGSIVGAIPPVMGWTACTGGSLSAGALSLGLLIYLWQFPHFNALSWRLRSEYTKAGYTMMCVTHSHLCKATALIHSVLLLPLCSFAIPFLGITNWTFAFYSAIPNLYLCYLCARFFYSGDSSSSKKLFLFTLAHLPIILFLSIISKTELSHD